MRNSNDILNLIAQGIQDNGGRFGLAYFNEGDMKGWSCGIEWGEVNPHTYEHVNVIVSEAKETAAEAVNDALDQTGWILDPYKGVVKDDN